MKTRARDVCDPITGEKFSIAWCPGCGMGATTPVPRALEAYYRERYYGNRHSFTDGFCNWRRQRMLRRALPGGGTRLLDVGCGDGAFLDTARRAGWQTVGIEPHFRPGRDHSHTIVGSLEEAGAYAPYDGITIWHVLEHMRDPMECLEQIRSMIAPGGVLLVAVPDFDGLQSRVFGRHWLHLDVPRHLHHFTRRSILRLLDDAGFEVLRTSHQELEYDWAGWIQSSLNVISGTPNVLMDALTGRPPRVAKWRVAATYAAACVLSGAALGLTLASTLLRRGGTIIVAARPRLR